MNRLRILIAEDERLARERLTKLIEERRELELVQVCRNGNEAFTALSEKNIDIALLDIQMPKLNGIGLSRRLCDGPSMPVFVFVTAHGHFAIDAFKVGAVDFLLKPYDRERLGRALHAAAERIQALCAIEQQRRICAVIKETEAEVLPKVSAHKRRLPKQIVIRSHRRMHIVRGDQVDWIEATGRYCLLHCGLSIHRVEGPLADVTRRLGDSLFLRVGRSAIVNVDNVVELQDKAELVALLKNGDQVRVSERRRLNVLNQLCGTGAWGACDDWTGTVHLGQTTMEKRADSGTKFPKG